MYPSATEDKAHAELQAGPYTRTHGEHHSAPVGDSGSLLFCLCTKHVPYSARARLAAAKCNHSLNSCIISKSSSKACREAFPKEFSCRKMASTDCRKSLMRQMFQLFHGSRSDPSTREEIQCRSLCCGVRRAPNL